MFGAAFGAFTLDDGDVVNQMALKMGCPALFEMSEWVDTRLSRGESGSFLFVSNYQDDAIETVIRQEGQTLFGAPGQIACPARCDFAAGMAAFAGSARRICQRRDSRDHSRGFIHHAKDGRGRI